RSPSAPPAHWSAWSRPPAASPTSASPSHWARGLIRAGGAATSRSSLPAVQGITRSAPNEEERDRLVVEEGQVELAQAVRVGQRVDLHDLPPIDREGQHR